MDLISVDENSKYWVLFEAVSYVAGMAHIRGTEGYFEQYQDATMRHELVFRISYLTETLVEGFQLGNIIDGLTNTSNSRRVEFRAEKVAGASKVSQFDIIISHDDAKDFISAIRLGRQSAVPLRPIPEQ
jgi:CHASE3 domain sensor protein